VRQEVARAGPEIGDAHAGGEPHGGDDLRGLLPGVALGALERGNPVVGPLEAVHERSSAVGVPAMPSVVAGVPAVAAGVPAVSAGMTGWTGAVLPVRGGLVRGGGVGVALQLLRSAVRAAQEAAGRRRRCIRAPYQEPRAGVPCGALSRKLRKLWPI
jgi:hypothetical protein